MASKSRQKSLHPCRLFSIWLHDLDSNQGPNDYQLFANATKAKRYTPPPKPPLKTLCLSLRVNPIMPSDNRN